ncbi:unnamed protein product [Nesidiocoris tenuis]|uniref:Uncharacterized protein n=1 Tax=Nesidiocoris tenuis TaxID=355587 RepID=A0A6H5GS84_9HEMI|nr:unnamed protein product [Nesidiocoris tenuis]
MKLNLKLIIEIEVDRTSISMMSLRFSFIVSLTSISIMSLCFCFIVSLTSISIMSLCFCFIVSLTSISIMSLCFCFIVSLTSISIMSLCFCFIVSLTSISIMSLSFCFIVSLTSISIMSLCFCFIVSLTSISMMSLRFCFICLGRNRQCIRTQHQQSYGLAKKMKETPAREDFLMTPAVEGAINFFRGLCRSRALNGKKAGILPPNRLPADGNHETVLIAVNESEAAVMRVNSWLYHYYTVQSKLQYGLAYDPAAQVSRMGNNNNNNTQYYQHPQSMSPYQENQVYHHHPHHHPQVSPSPHHHQPIPQALGHPEAFRYSSGRRSEPEPVDYSVHSEPDIKVESSPRSSPASVDLDRGGGGGGGGGGGTLLMSATQSLGRSRLLVKAATTLDPAELMDQWNPSPPWSDTALQKVPDILHQDLSPYVTTTPPTPGSAVSYQHPPPPAFTFDWPPHEQYVPNVNMNVNTPLALMDEEHSQLLSMGGCWSHHQTPASAGVVSDHRLFPLQPPPPPRPALLLRLEQESAADQHILLPAVTKGKIAEYVSFVNLSGARTIMAMVSGNSSLEILLGQTTAHRFPLPKKKASERNKVFAREVIHNSNRSRDHRVNTRHRVTLTIESSSSTETTSQSSTVFVRPNSSFTEQIPWT